MPAHAWLPGMTHAFSCLASHQTGYDAALKVYPIVQRLSLFNCPNL